MNERMRRANDIRLSYGTGIQWTVTPASFVANAVRRSPPAVQAVTR